MYIKLGTVKTTLADEKNNDFTIISEIIPGCSMSYEVPRFVRTETELDIWFGEFPSKNYLRSLLKSEVSLFLYRPVLDLNFGVVEEVGEEENLPETGTSGVLYISYNGEYVWDGSKYVSVDDFKSSTTNRDTLALFSDAYCHPEYKITKEYSNLRTPTDDYKSKLDNIENGLSSYVYDLKIENELEDGSYLIIPINNGNLLVYSGDEVPKVSNEAGTSLLLNYSTEQIKYTTKESLLRTLETRGWYIIDSVGGIIGSTTCKENLEFFSGGFSLEPNKRLCWRIISNTLNSEKDTRDENNNIIPGTPIIKFWSKTIGKGTTPIEIECSKNDDEEYLFSITRGDYSEHFEGSLSNIEGSISTDSKLIHCELFESSAEIPEGKWKLSGAEDEAFNSSSYRNALSILSKNLDYDTYPDFHLVPNPSDYVDEGYDYENLYKDFLVISNQCGCQFLIQNDETNYSSNYTKDVDSRLVWFMGEILVNNVLYPGYSPFIHGLLHNNYSLELTNVFYISPVDAPYDTGDSEELDKYRSNYLVYNNHKYYFKKYLSGSNTSIWTRFVLNKIERELQKQKWDYLGKNTRPYEKITQILNQISLIYSGIIRSIKISVFLEEPVEESLYLLIDTTLSDVPDKDITLDITINYSKN